MRSIIAIIFVVFAVSSSAYSQTIESLWAFKYQISIPNSDTKNFSDQTSFLGWEIEHRNFIKPNISVGGSLGWHIFKEETSEEIEFNTTYVDTEISGSLSGQQFRYINAFPILVNAHYYVGDESGTRAYAGLNLGTSIISKRIEIGVFAVDKTKWHFTVAPEIGILLQTPGPYVMAGVKYYYSAKTSETKSNGYLSLGLGIVSSF